MLAHFSTEYLYRMICFDANVLPLQALEVGDTVCMFPEGMSRYQPGLAPLKTGVARIISEVLSRRRDDPSYELTLLTCSITYMHRYHFRSDLLVTFNPPVAFWPQVKTLLACFFIGLKTDSYFSNLQLC